MQGGWGWEVLDGRASVSCREFPESARSVRIQEMDGQVDAPNWPEAQIQRLMAQIGGESVEVGGRLEVKESVWGG